MQRWQLTLGLSAGVALAALVVPELLQRGAAPREAASGEAAPVREVAAPAPAAQQIDGLQIRAGLSNPAVPAGSASERYVVVTLEGTRALASAEQPINVAVVMDRSGSMEARSKMSYAKRAARELVEALDADDRFALVSFSDRAEVPIPSTYLGDRQATLRAIYAVQAGGGTNLYEGLSEGFSQARDGWSSEALSRVVLLSDGNANVGITDEAELTALAGRWTDEGISLSTMGLGLDYNEDLLAAMADRGGGSYRFIDDPSALAAVFSEELQQLASVAARGVMVSVETAPGVELLDVLGYDEERREGAVRVRVGDVREGESRKVVLKLRVPAADAGSTLPVLSLAASTADGALAGSFEVAAEAVSDRALLAASEDRELAILAAQAVASALAEEATRAYERGDRSEMRALLRASQSVSRSAAEAYDSQLLREQLDQLGYQERSFDETDARSSSGLFQVKRAKETYRSYAR